MHIRTLLAMVTILVAGLTAPASADYDEPYALNQSNTVRIDRPLPQDMETETTTTTTTRVSSSRSYISQDYVHGFRNVSDFFNIREANPQIGEGMWQVEVGSGWVTKSNGRDDDFFAPGAALLYGVTDNVNVALKLLPMNLGDGDWQGNGDLAFQIFGRLMCETDLLPAFATYGEMRIPSGNGSSGVDATFGAVATKTILPRFRVHLDHYIKTVNGRRGYQTPEDYRHFQWGIGPGFDYLIDDCTTAILNYRMTSSEEYGRHNSNVLQLGLARVICEDDCTAQNLRIAMDIGLDGQDESPNFGMKIQYAIAIK